jgi:hypothetical protein
VRLIAEPVYDAVARSVNTGYHCLVRWRKRIIDAEVLVPHLHVVVVVVAVIAKPLNIAPALELEPVEVLEVAQEAATSV